MATKVSQAEQPTESGHRLLFVLPAVGRWLARDAAMRHLPGLLSAMGLWAYFALRSLAPATALRSLLASARYAPSARKSTLLRQELPALPSTLHARMPDDVTIDHAARRSIILGAPRRRGDTLVPGVLLISFTNTNRFFHHHIDLRRLQQYFCIVLEPSWAGYALPEILLWTTAPEPVLVQATEHTDRQLLRELDCNLVPVSFGASNWVDHRVFRPLDLPKTYDAVYVASYSPTKRVHVFFRALRRVAKKDPGFRAALICSSWGGERRAVRSLVRHYGVGGCLELIEDLPPPKLNEVLNRSKCNILLSIKEGSNRSLFEAMFADVPVVMLANNVGVNRDYINSHTGLLTTEEQLPDALLHMKHHGTEYHPHHWAMSNLAPEVTTTRLGLELERAHPHLSGAFDGLWVKVNSPEVAYFSESRTPDHTDITRSVLQQFLRGRSRTDDRAMDELALALESR